MSRGGHFLFARLLVGLCFALITQFAAAQVTEGWTSQFTNSAFGFFPSKQALDAQGNTYVCGSTSLDAQSDEVCVTLKYDRSGVLQWVQTFTGGGRFNNANSVAVDNSGNVYVVGGCDHNNLSSAVILRYDSDGNQKFATFFNANGSGADSFSSVTCDTSGGIYAVGSTNTSNDGGDFLTVKFDANGAVVWSATLDSPMVAGDHQIDFATIVKVDGAGNVLMGGSSSNHYDATVARYSPSGQFLWSKTSLPSGNTGIGGVEFGPGGSIYFVSADDTNINALRYDSNGNVIFNAVIADQGGNANSTGVDPEGRLVIGAFTPTGGRILKLDLNGNAVFDVPEPKIKFNTKVFLDGENIYVSGTVNSDPQFHGIVTDRLSPTGSILWTATYPQISNSTYDIKQIIVYHPGFVSILLHDAGALQSVLLAYFENPVDVDDQYAASQGIQLNVPTATGVLSNDALAIDSRAILVSNPLNGTVTLNEDGSFSYKSNNGFIGTDTFQYKAEHGLSVGNVATVSITVDPPLSSVSVSPTTVVGGSPTKGTVTLGSVAPAGGIVVNLSASSQVIIPPPTVTIPAGSKTASFTVNTMEVDGTYVRSLIASLNGITKTANLTLLQKVKIASLVISPNTITGGLNTTGTVTTNIVAPAGGAVVALSANSSVLHVPASVTVPAGSNTVNFTVGTSQVSVTATRQVTATLNGSKTANVTLLPTAALKSLTMNPSSVVGGNDSIGTVTLATPAPPSGEVVDLTSGSGSIQVPANVAFSSGATSATFTAHTSAVSQSVTRTITASFLGVSKVANLTLNPVGITSLTLNPTTVKGGSPSIGTVTLNGPAPSGGALITLTSGSVVIHVPGSITIASGQTSGTFTATTSTVSATVTRTISATFNGVTKSANLTITP